MDIDDIIAMAKQFVMEDGTHAHTLLIETDKPQMIVSELRGISGDPGSKLVDMAAAGRELARQVPGDHIVSVAHISMNWAVTTPIDQPDLTIRPSLHPDRIEMLMITHLESSKVGWKRADHVFQVLRQGKTTDLLPLSDVNKLTPGGDMISFLIAGFEHPTLKMPEITRIARNLLTPR